MLVDCLVEISEISENFLSSSKFFLHFKANTEISSENIYAFLTSLIWANLVAIADGTSGGLTEIAHS